MKSCSSEEYFYQLDNMIIRSTQHLRQIFKQRWKVQTGEDWRDDATDIQTFLTNHCEKLLKKAMPLQKKLLFASCTLGDWDISLLSLVLLNFGDKNKHKLQNQAVRQLKDLRNYLAHHQNKKLTQNEYCEKLKIFKESLQMLEIGDDIIDKLIEDSSISSSLENTERLNLLLENAEQLMKTQDFECALNQYSEAITIPLLSPENLGNVYEKRAFCLLSLQNDHDLAEKYTDQAILDVEEALKLNSLSWNAHHLKAQCYKKKNNLSEAIRYYKMTLAMFPPVPKQIKQELDSCELLDSIQKSNAHLNLDRLPLSGNDILGNFVDKSGRKLTVTKYAELCGYQNFPVFLGENYYHGVDVSQNYAKAVKYFIQADKQGYAEGCFMLGHCYYRGHGVPQDVSKSVEIFKRCAKMDARKRRKYEMFTPLGFNHGVASAEYGIGKCYEHGIGVEENLSEAVIWYTRAMEHGQEEAAVCLGILYYDGEGLTKNEKMAEMCWKQGLNLGGTESAELLVEYYRRQVEPDMAWIMFKIAREMGSHKYLQISEEEFNQNLAVIQSERYRLDERVTRFEEMYNFGFKGMTFRARVSRTDQYPYLNYAGKNSNGTINTLGGQIQKNGKNFMTADGIKSICITMKDSVEHLKSVLERKEYMQSPVRKGLIIQHRERLRDVMGLNLIGLPFDDKLVLGKHKQKRIRQLAHVKPITLQEMNPTKDQIFENRTLDLTIIEEPNIYSNSIQLVAEDDNGDTTRVYVNTVAAENVIWQRFAAGSRIAVINPCMGICARDGVNGIRINEPKCVMYLEKACDLCRFCGEENASRKCSKCRRLYCSRECQKLDWQLFQHKLICWSNSNDIGGHESD